MGIKGEVEEDISRRGFLRGAGALAAGAALGATGANAQTSGEDYLPDIVAHVRFKVNGKEITKDINLGTTYKSPKEAAEALEKFLKSKGIKYFEYELERVKPKDDDYMDKTPYSKNDAGNDSNYLDKRPATGSKSKTGYMEDLISELSTDLLGRYKKAAGADASAADKAGDVERGNKRFKGIVKATIKQGDNDSKKHKEQGKS